MNLLHCLDKCCQIYKPFELRVLTEPLKEIVCFDNVYTAEEFYWLIVIALNISAESNY